MESSRGECERRIGEIKRQLSDKNTILYVVSKLSQLEGTCICITSFQRNARSLSSLPQLLLTMYSVFHSWVECPHHVLFQLQQLRLQDSAVVDAVLPTVK